MKSSSPKPTRKAAAKAEVPKPEGVHQSVNRKRDAIVGDLKRIPLAPEYEEAVQRMEDHLRSQRKRCTVERRFVLQMLYQLAQPIDIGTLHELICEELGNVALPTVYTTLDLLVRLRLAQRFELVTHGMAFFERTLGVEPHGYAVCNECGAFSPLRYPSLLDDVQRQLPRGFSPMDYSLIIHGLCSKCQRRTRARRKQ